MSEIIIRSNNPEMLQKLAELVRLFGLEVVAAPTKNATARHVKLQGLPVVVAQKPNALALSGIWKNRKISLDQIHAVQDKIRQSAWGERL